MAQCGDPISTRTLSSHWRGPWRWISIQHGVDVTSWRWYSAPHPFTNDILHTDIERLIRERSQEVNKIRSRKIRSPDCTHFSEVINGLKAMIDRLAKERGEFPVVEYLEGASRRDLAHGRRMETVRVVAVPTLDEDCRVT